MPGPSLACGEVMAWLWGGGDHSAGEMPADDQPGACHVGLVRGGFPGCAVPGEGVGMAARRWEPQPRAIPGAAGAGGSLPALLGQEERQSTPLRERGGGSGWG